MTIRDKLEAAIADQVDQGFACQLRGPLLTVLRTLADAIDAELADIDAADELARQSVSNLTRAVAAPATVSITGSGPAILPPAPLTEAEAEGLRQAIEGLPQELRQAYREGDFAALYGGPAGGGMGDAAPAATTLPVPDAPAD